MTQRPMIITCQKCGAMNTSYIELANSIKCPNCGRHGDIILTNSMPLYIMGVLIFVSGGE